MDVNVNIINNISIAHTSENNYCRIQIDWDYNSENEAILWNKYVYDSDGNNLKWFNNNV